MPGDTSARAAVVADVELTDTLTRSRASSRPASFVPRMPSQAFAVSPHAKRVRRTLDADGVIDRLGPARVHTSVDDAVNAALAESSRT